MAIPLWAPKVFGKLLDSVEGLVTSGDERGAVRQAIFEAQAELASKALEYEQTVTEAQSAVIVAEAKSEGLLTRTWRPTVMLFFSALVGAHWLGFTPDNLDPAAVLELLAIVKYGLSGYVVGRSGEKIAKTLTKYRPGPERAGKAQKILEAIRNG